MSGFFFTAILILSSMHSLSAVADPESCRDALDQYKAAKSELSGAIRTYASCVSGNDGHDDCSSEFMSLQSDQSAFESAVSEYESECQ